MPFQNNSQEELEHFETNTSSQPLLDASNNDVEVPDIRAFLEQYGLEHESSSFEQAANHAALDNNGRSKWHQPFLLYLCITVTALGAMGQGWAQVGINGANLYYPQLFGIDSDSSRDTLIVGFINCGIYLSNGLLGSWLVTPFNRYLGRRGATFVGALLSFLMNCAGSATYSWEALLICRLLLGVGLGLVSSSLNVFAAECSPASIRGGLAVAWQMFCAFGIFVGFAVNMLVDNDPEAYGPMRWRVMLLAAAAPAVPLLFLIWLCPESPAWYVKNGEQYDRAFESLCRIRSTKVEAAREILLACQQQKSTLKSKKHKSSGKTFLELYTVPRIRRATLAAYTTMISQQLCGINIISFYSATIFVQAKFPPYYAELASTIFGLCNFIGALPAIWTMDSFGRRSLVLYTLPPMAISMAITGFSFSITDRKVSFGLTTSMIYLFCLLYSPGMGPVPMAYSAEVFPLSHRELGTSSAVAVTNTFAAILSLTFPYLLAKLGTQGSFLLYAVLNVVAWVLVFLFVPETKRQTLEGLDEVFSIPTRDFAKYNVQKYILRRDVEKPGIAIRSGDRYEEISQEAD